MYEAILMRPKYPLSELCSDIRVFYLNDGCFTNFLLVFLEIALAAVFEDDVPIALESKLIEAFDDIGVIEFIHEFYFFLGHLCILNNQYFTAFLIFLIFLMAKIFLSLTF
jgi:hypothetical protein